MYRNVIITIVVAAVITWAAGCSDSDSPTNVKPGDDGDTRAPAAITDSFSSSFEICGG